MNVDNRRLAQSLHLGYKQLLHYLIFRGYTINAIITDGFKGLNKAFSKYPIQLCQFHQKKTINRYLTRNPKLDMAIDLQKIMHNLTTTTEAKFTKKLDTWYEKYKDVLLEKSINSETKKASYTHPKVVSAYRSIRRNIPYLFTYKKYPDLKINNSTNAIVPQEHKKWWSVFTYAPQKYFLPTVRAKS